MVSIPERWLPCPRKGKLVAGIFLPCKTPLDSRYEHDIPAKDRFTPEMLISSTRSLSCGLVIDLTNTNRFYSSEVFQKSNIEYLKIACRGHGATPEPVHVRTFISSVNGFLKRRPNDKIIVHCTHGFNRTGYLIMQYLVQSESFEVTEALNAFAEARPPGIYKQDYLDEISQEYPTTGKLQAPPLPDWCITAAPEDPSAANAATNQSRKRPTSSNIKHNLPKVPKFMDGVSGVIPITDSDIIFQVQERLRIICKFSNQKFPGSQPVSMDRQNCLYLLQKPYMVSWKADGTRYMMIIMGKDQVYMVDRDNCVYQVQKLFFPRLENTQLHLENTLLDGEMVIDCLGSTKTPRYLVYDIIMYEGKHVAELVLEERFKYISEKIIAPRSQLIIQGKISKEAESFSLRKKDFYDISKTESLLDVSFKSQLLHEMDGLIFQPAGVSDMYQCGKCEFILKWKPPELNTIDCLLKIQQKRLPGCIPELEGTLMAGGDGGAMDRRVALIPQMSVKDKFFDNKIVECNFDGVKKKWTILRERTDKSFPNHITTIEAVINSILHPVNKHHLLKLISENVVPKKQEIVDRDKRHTAAKLKAQELLEKEAADTSLESTDTNTSSVGGNNYPMHTHNRNDSLQLSMSEDDYEEDDDEEEEDDNVVVGGGVGGGGHHSTSAGKVPLELNNLPSSVGGYNYHNNNDKLSDNEMEDCADEAAVYQTDDSESDC